MDAVQRLKTEVIDAGIAALKRQIRKTKHEEIAAIYREEQKILEKWKTEI